MTTTNLVRRLDKIEASTRPPRGVFYVAWGRTSEEIERGLEEARLARTIATGDPVVRAPWPFGPPLPPSRWARDEVTHFTHEEFGALMGLVDEARDELIDAIHCEIPRHGVDPPAAPDEEPPARERDDTTRRMTDAVLLKAVIAVPLDGEPAKMTEARLKRVITCIEEAGLRTSIRGCDAALVKATDEAARAPRH